MLILEITFTDNLTSHITHHVSRLNRCGWFTMTDTAMFFVE